MSTSDLNPEELLVMENLMKDNKMLRRKLKYDSSSETTKKNRRVPVRVYVKDAEEITSMRKKLKELEKMEAMYKSRIDELENQVSGFHSFHDSIDNGKTGSLPQVGTGGSLRDHRRKQIESSNKLSMVSSDSDYSSGTRTSIQHDRSSVHENNYEQFTLPQAMGSLRRSSNTDRTKLLALYDFNPAPETKGRLGFKEGDVLLLVNMKSRSGWWTAELNGKTGKIPCNYVEQLDPSRAFKARVIKNFDSQQPGDMSIQRGTMVTVLKKQDNGWHLGERGSKTGFFPSDCVERISTPFS